MNAQELVKMAGESHPELIGKTAVALSMLEKVAPEFLPDTVQEMNYILNMPIEKLAAAPTSSFGSALAGSIGSAVVGAVASDLYDAAKRGLTKGSNFQRIMEFNPELKKFDKKQLTAAYDTLHRFAPEFTADPNLGGQILHNMADLPNNQRVMIESLIKQRKELRDTRKNQLSPGWTR